MAVPLMCRLDASLLRASKRLKLIIQYGVGVEGIDIPTVQAASSPLQMAAVASTSKQVLLVLLCCHLCKHAVQPISAKARRGVEEVCLRCS